MTALDKLIEAVEAGTLDSVWHGCSSRRGHWAYDTGLNATQRNLAWQASHGSLDAADTLMTILPEGAKWMRMSDGAFIVWLPGTPISASADATGNISRDLFLAILRAYRSVQA